MKNAATGSESVAATRARSLPLTILTHRWIAPAFLCIICFAVFASAARQHPIGTYWTETDFYHYYGPDAARLARGEFPANPYQGPGFPALVAFIAKFTGDTFSAGKWISVVCGTLAVALAFALLSRLFGYWVGLGAAALVPVSAQYAQFAIGATTDALFLALCLGCLVVFLNDGMRAEWRAPVAGVLAGCAYLVRYNGLFLAVTIAIAILGLNVFSCDWRRRIKLAESFLGALLITISPWLYLNYVNRGSPFYNANYLNIATTFYPELADAKTNQDGTRVLESRFTSLADVVRYDPGRLLKQYPINLYHRLREIQTSDLVSFWTAWLAVAGFFLVLFRVRSRARLTLLISAVIYLLLMGLTHWETRYYFFMMAVYCGLAVFAVAQVYEFVKTRVDPGRAGIVFPIGVFILMWWSSYVMARSDLKGFLANHPYEVVAACEYLKKEGVVNARIVARKPHLPAICGQQWVFLPSVASLEELHEWLTKNPAEYLVISSVEAKRRPELASLQSKATAPDWLEAVWEDKDPLFILYRTKL